MRFAKRFFSEKWDRLEKKFGSKDLIPMWIADPDFEVAPKIYEEVKKLTNQKNYGYGYYIDSLYENIISWHKDRFGVDIKKDWIVFIPGVLAGIDIANSLIDGDTIIQPPVYPPFFKFGKILNPIKNSQIDFEHLKRVQSKKLLFCSPHNPIGRVWSKDELKELAKYASQKSLLVISDEIHADIVYEKKHYPFWQFYDKTVAIYSASKSFCIAGLSFAYAIIVDRRLRVEFKKRARFLSTNIFGIVATKAAYESKEWLEEFLSYLKQNRDFIYKNLKFSHKKIEGTYLIWVKKEIDNFNEKILNEAKVAPSFGEEFGDKNYFRLNIATDFNLIEEMVNRINRLK